MLCRVCPGSGHILHNNKGELEFWPCPACGGSGARIVHGPPTIHCHSWREKFRNKKEKKEKVIHVSQQ